MIKIGNENHIRRWIKEHYKELGFDTVRGTVSPDMIATKDGKEVKVEIETRSSNFIKHGHPSNYADLVICAEKDCELPIPIYEIEDAEYLEGWGAVKFGIDFKILQLLRVPRTRYEISEYLNKPRFPIGKIFIRLENNGLIKVIKREPWCVGEKRYYEATEKGKALVKYLPFDWFEEADRRE